MSHKLKTPLNNGAEYVRHCQNHPNLKSYRVSGSHYTFETAEGRATIACHNRELPFWLRKKIMVELVAIGLGLLFIAVLVLPYA